MPEPFESKRDAPFVGFDADVVSRVDGLHFKVGFFPQDATMDFSDGDVPFSGFLDDLLPFGFVFLDGAVACPKFLDGERFQYGFGATEMVLVGVRDDERVELPHADVMQKWNDDVFAGILPAVVAGVHEKMPAGWRLDKMAIALPDIDGCERPRRMQNFAVAFKCK